MVTRKIDREIGHSSNWMTKVMMATMMTIDFPAKSKGCTYIVELLSSSAAASISFKLQKIRMTNDKNYGGWGSRLRITSQIFHFNVKIPNQLSERSGQIFFLKIK